MDIKDQIEAVWDVYDKDKNGYLDKKEVDQFLNDVFEGEKDSKDIIKQIKRLVDKDGDNLLKKHELESVMKQFM